MARWTAWLVAAALLTLVAAAGDRVLRAQDGPAGVPARAPQAPEAPPLRAGDLIDLAVFDRADLSTTATVQPDGTISLHFVGRIPAAGRLPAEVAADVAAGLELVHSLKALRVSLAVRTPAPRAVYILGRVRSPGSHPLPNRPLTALQLVALAGGFEDDADRGRVYLHRDGNGGRAVLTLDLTGVESSGSVANDIAVEDGDTVFVPRAEEVSVIGEVNLPGPFIPRAGAPLTVLSALSKARGFTRYADKGDVLWIRGSGATRKVQRLDAARILRGDAPDPEVLPGDVLFVTERAW